MIVWVRLEIVDEVRRALRARCGEPGLATRREIQSLVEMMLEHDVGDAVRELKESRERRRARK